MAMSRVSWIIINDWNLFFKKLGDELPFEFCLAKVDIVVYYIDIFEASFHEKEEKKRMNNDLEQIRITMFLWIAILDMQQAM